MRNRLLLAAAIWLLATPAFAGFSIPGCAPGTFDVIARTKIGLEQGATEIGNLLVTQNDGQVAVGAHNKIGTIVADSIFMGTGATAEKCIADSITGPGTCLTTAGPNGFTNAPAACKVFDFTPPVIPICVNTALVINVPAGTTETLAPGCYGIIRVGLGATLHLEPGIFLARELRTLAGATVDGSTGIDRSKVLVRNATLSPASKLLHLDILAASTIGDSIVFGSGVKLEDVTAISAASAIHLHSGFNALNSGIAATRVVVEPGVFKSDDAPPFCVCPLGTAVPGGQPVCLPILN